VGHNAVVIRVSSFVWQSVVASQICEIPQNTPKFELSSISFKVIDFGGNQKRTYMLLPIAIDGNFGRIPYRVFEILSNCSKIAPSPHMTLTHRLVEERPMQHCSVI